MLIGYRFPQLAQNLDTTTAGGMLIFHVFGAVAEFEKTLIVERTQAGLKSARARGALEGVRGLWMKNGSE